MILFILQLLFDSAIKAALLLGLAWAITHGLRRSSAAIRHMTWTAAVLAVLLLPGLSMVLPHWRVEIVSSLIRIAAPPESVAPALVGGTTSVDAIHREAHSASIFASNVNPPHPIPRKRTSLPALALILWLSGATAVMMPWVLSMLVMHRVGRRAGSIDTGVVRRVFDAICEELRIQHRPMLLGSRDPMLPLAWGIFKSHVIVPQDATTWPAERLRTVLLHELAHVQRWDCATQFIAQIVCAIHWFNPLAWLAAQSMRRERERACDDVVLARAASATSYSEHLVQIARHFRAPGLSRLAVVAIARPSQLYTRVQAILDPACNRMGVTRHAKLAALALATSLVLPLAMMRAAAPAVVSAPAEKMTIDLGGGVSMQLVLIHPGSFLTRQDGNVRRVMITKPFYMGKFEVTQEQWQAVMGDNPSYFQGAMNPVENVSWENCQAFLQKLSQKIPGQTFKLPTDAQWEYACRAGSAAEFSYGDDVAGLGEYAWFGGNSENMTHPVGEMKPNAWGLYDMQGNVWEWCADRYNADTTGSSSSLAFVLRGGSWNDEPELLRATHRDGCTPGSRDSLVSVRVVCLPAELSE